MSQVTYKSEKYTKKRVYLSTTSTIRAGMAVCYNSDYGTATSAADARAYKVEAPATGNDHAFAGIVTEEYDGIDGPAWIEIYVPTRRGQLVKALTAQSCVIDDHILAISTGSFQLGPASAGYNIAKAAQTKSAATSGLTLVRLYGSDNLQNISASAKAETKYGAASSTISAIHISTQSVKFFNGNSTVTVNVVANLSASIV